VREPGQGVAPVLLRRVTSGGAVGREAGAEPVDEALKHQGPGAALPEDVRRDAEARLGTDFARVRVHTDPAAGRAARAVGARAFAFGEHIFFAPGESPWQGSAATRLLLHELTHVIQAQRGQIPASAAGRRISQPGDALEQEAERAATAAERQTPAAVAPLRRDEARVPATEARGGLVLRDGPLGSLVTDRLGFKVEEDPSKGEATISRDGVVLAWLVWEPKEGRRLDKLSFSEGTKRVDPVTGITVLDMSIGAEFAIDVTVDGSAEQSLANSALHGTTEITHHFDFHGAVNYRTVDGRIVTSPGPTSFGMRYMPLRGEELVPREPPKVIDAGPDPLAPPLEPAAPLPKIWTFKDPAIYDRFAASHSNTKWAEIKTREGTYVAWALTIEAVTRMADKVRASREDFEFLSAYPDGKVVAVHLAGRKLPQLADLGDLYYRTVDAALDGSAGALAECEVGKMEGGRFSRRGLGHSQALVRWKEIESRDAHPLMTLVPDDPANKAIVLQVPNEFVALRVVGDHGLQTIYPSSLKDPARRRELKSGFTTFDPLGDDLSNPLPADVPYADATKTLGTLLRRKRDIVVGREPPDELEAINGRIDDLRQQLSKQGVNLEEGRLLEAIDAGRELRRIDGRVVATPSPPNFFNQRMTFRPAFDYLPPSAKVTIFWHWRAHGRDAQFFSAPSRDPVALNEIVLDDFFWNFVPPDVEAANGLEVLAEVYIDGAKTSAATLKSGWLTFASGRALPATVTIDGDKVVVEGARKQYKLAEWVPGRGYSVDWRIDGAVVATMPVLTHQFDKTGTAHLVAQIYSVEDTFSRTRHFLRDVAKDITVQKQVEAGQALVDQMKTQGQSRLADVGASLDASIEEMEKRAAQGGGQKPYWENRIEQQKKRRDKLAELSPDVRKAEDLPADSTALDETKSYSKPIPASLVLPEAGGAQPLAIYLTVHKDGAQWAVRLLDMTSADVWKFDGAGDTPLAAYTAAFEAWKANNPYPKSGRVVFEFKPTGWTFGTDFDTWRIGKLVKDWVDGILMVGGLVVAGLLLAAPEATVTKALGMILLAASVSRATVQIADNLTLGIRPWVYRIGSWTVMASLAGDAGTLVYVSASALSQLQAVRADPTLSDDQRSMETLRVISVLIGQGALFIVANKDMIKGGLKRSDFFGTEPKATADRVRALPTGEVAKLDTGSRLDVAAELRKAGEAPARLQAGKLSDAALMERYFALPWLRESLSESEVGRVLNRLETPALKAYADVPANKVKSAMDAIGNDAVVNDLAGHLAGGQLTSLVDQLGGRKVADLHAAFGAAGTATLVDEVGQATVARLLKAPGGTSAASLKQLAGELGHPAVKNLAAADTGRSLTGVQLEALVKKHGAERCKWVGSALQGPEAETMLDALTNAAVDKLRDVGPRQVEALLRAVGTAKLEAAAAVANGSQLHALRDAFGDKGFAKVLDEYLRTKASGKSLAGRIAGFGSNLATRAALPATTLGGGASALDGGGAMRAQVEVVIARPFRAGITVHVHVARFHHRSDDLADGFFAALGLGLVSFEKQVAVLAAPVAQVLDKAFIRRCRADAGFVFLRIELQTGGAGSGLLRHMSQLVREQLLRGRPLRCVFAGREDHVAAVREGASAQVFGRLGRGALCVDAHAAEVGLQRGLHRRAFSDAERHARIQLGG
jgi:hypothetical protein